MKVKHFCAPLEIKTTEDKTGIFTGYGSVFGNKDSYDDIVVKGAFSQFLSMNSVKDVKLLWQHNSDMPIGVYKEIREDEKGLFMVGQLLIDEVEKAREAYALLKAGAISGLSIGFSVNQNGSHIGTDGVRYLTDLDLWETSLVTFPANRLANITGIKNIKNAKDYEQYLRNLGISRKKAIALTSIASKGFHDQSDSDGNCLVSNGSHDQSDSDGACLVLALRKLAQSIQSEVKNYESRNQRSC